MFLFRRKLGRTTGQNDHSTSAIETSASFEDGYHHSPKALLISTKSCSPTQKKHNRQIRPSTESAGEDIAPVLPPRKPLDKKSNIQMTSNTPVFISSSRLQSITNEDILSTSLPDSLKLSSKEISTSLANLMGTASDSITVNNTTQIPTHETRHISSTSAAATVDRLGLIESSSNVCTAGMVESSLSQRTVFTGNSSSTSSPSSYTKATNDYTWCYENSVSIHTNNGTNFDEYLPRLEIDDKPLIYRQQFEPIEHFNWYGISEIVGPVIISYKYSIDQNKQRCVMAIVRTRQRTSIESVFYVSPSISSIDILRRICEQCSINDIEHFDPVLCDGTHDLLLKYDESHVSNQHKFGIIYQRENQLTEEDLFSNETHSIAMEKFLNLIGNHVKLKDFQGFRGGLDIKSDHTGTESIYEQFNNHEIMFHVSTLLPHSKIERQQLERKRHIGNDIVAIIFQENETIFNPECIASQFIHVYLVVTAVNTDKNQFKVSVIHRDSVPSFGPTINHSNLFDCDQIFKQWILTKLINAEMASCRASTFQKYQERTKMNLFENLYRTLHDNNRPLMNFILNHSQYKHECEIEQQKEEIPIYSPTKTSDSSLLGSVRRRLIAPKLRTQNSTTPPPPPTTIVISTPSSNDSRSKIRTMTMDLRRSASRESMTTNGKIASIFSLSKTNSPRIEKSTTNRSLLEADNSDFSLSSRSNTKFLSPVTCPSTPSKDLNPNEDLYPSAPSFHFNKSSSDDTINDTHNQFVSDDLQSLSKNDLIKFVIALQQQHSTKLIQMDQIHSKALKQLEIQLIQQQNTINGDSL